MGIRRASVALDELLVAADAERERVGEDDRSRRADGRCTGSVLEAGREQPGNPSDVVDMDVRDDQCADVVDIEIDVEVSLPRRR